jgi:prepilin-type N-terminal cleavage/methylation domain-containing protein
MPDLARPAARRLARRGAHVPRRRRGFTIVEVIAAVVVLAVGVLGLAGTAAMVTRLLGQGDRQTDAAVMAQKRFEQLRATRCPVAGGLTTASGATEQWTVIAPIGPASLRLYEVNDSVSYRIRGKTKGWGYRSIIECLP